MKAPCVGEPAAAAAAGEKEDAAVAADAVGVSSNWKLFVVFIVNEFAAAAGVLGAANEMALPSVPTSDMTAATGERERVKDESEECAIAADV